MAKLRLILVLLVTATLCTGVDSIAVGQQPKNLLATPDEIANKSFDGHNPNSITSQFPGYTLTSAKGNAQIFPERIEDAESSESGDCQNVLNVGYDLARSDADFNKAFDTARYYVDHCSTEPNSGDVFGLLVSVNGNATQLKGSSGQLYFRNYLISILYVSPSDQWYCNAAYALVHTSRNSREALGLIKFLLGNVRCKDLAGNLGYSYYLIRRNDYYNWHDSVTVDTNKYPYDSTLASLHDMGLDTLLYHAGVSIKGTLAHQMIVSSQITINPFSQVTGVEFDLSQMAYVRLEVYDELGRMIQGDGNGHVYDQGSHTLQLEGLKWSPGTYYVRLSTGNGEVQTLKLVKTE